MIWTRLRSDSTPPRLRAVDDLQFPASGRQRLLNQHPHLSGDDIRLVEAATRQWFRLVVRHSDAKLSMPSVIVDDLWQELTLHKRDYATFCDAAFGRLLHHQPRSATSAGTVNRNPRLLATLSCGRRDEECGPTGLPLLFRVDQELRIQDGNRYLADCGGRGECFPVANRVCLQHLGGPGRRPKPPGIRGDLPFNDGRHGYGGGAGGGGGGDGELYGAGDGGGGDGGGSSN
ncbi:hypothetical protein GA0070607_5632 [Micromonospora coriariae]|uniref:Uncharacterized protein n=1 Tax=Micromonospora coriariae TaxID=285665 RepID=A0A1C4XQU6_9ACTN|nr:hypothetical protein [Micromonospora coriariae]SCF10877.1 hypothetical protein GA0070607_5632 [Micromonospora coriariae]